VTDCPKEIGHMPLNLILASRNLFHDRVRFIATILGIVFSVILIIIQMGLYLGFGRMVTSPIDHAKADLWIVHKGTKFFEDPSLLNINLEERISATRGVAKASQLVIGFSGWILPGGEITPVFVIGSDLESKFLEPWDITDGNTNALMSADAVAVDSSYFERLSVSQRGSQASIRGHPAQVAAVTTGIRSFTTTPYVFTEINRARGYIGLPVNLTSYFLVKTAPDANIAQVRQDLRTNVANVEVLTNDEFRDRTRNYWLFGTGAGAALFAGSVLGLVVGAVIVAQTLYSSTKDHLNEFATLRAMGSSNRYIYAIIIYQAVLNAVIGFCLAALLGLLAVSLTANAALPVLITPDLMAAVFALTVAMCVISAFAAIVRIFRIDPVMVFTQ
jgi:putative ABC transport system permease protein